MTHPNGYRLRLAFPFFKEFFYEHTPIGEKNNNLEHETRHDSCFDCNKSGHGQIYSCEAPHSINKNTTNSTADNR